MSRRKPPKGCFWRGTTLWGRIQVGGKDHKWSLRTDDHETAKRRFKIERDRQISAYHFGDHRKLFAEVVASWGAWIARNVSAKTAKRYATSLKQLKPHLDGLYLDEVDAACISEIIRQRRAARISNATIKRDLGAVSSVMNHAIDEGWCENNPVLPRLRTVKERRDPIELPDHTHIQMVIDNAPGLFSKMIEAALRTGARQDELVRACRHHVDHQRRQLTVQKGKRGKLRTIDLDGWGYDEVFKGLPACLGSQSLFWHHNGEPFRTAAGQFKRVVRQVAKKAQKQEQEFRPFRFHDLRHRHAVDWLKAGKSIYDLQHRLGHTSIKTTEIYLDYLTPEEVRRVKQQEQRPEQG